MNGIFSHEKMAQEILNYLNDGIKGVNKMFDQQKIAQTVFNLAKDYTNTTTQIMKTSMELYEKTLETMLKQGAGTQEEGKKLFSDWMNRAKQGLQQYSSQMEENLKKIEVFFNPSEGQKKK